MDNFIIKFLLYLKNKKAYHFMPIFEHTLMTGLKKIFYTFTLSL